MRGVWPKILLDLGVPTSRSSRFCVVRGVLLSGCCSRDCVDLIMWETSRLLELQCSDQTNEFQRDCIHIVDDCAIQVCIVYM